MTDAMPGCIMLLKKQLVFSLRCPLGCLERVDTHLGHLDLRLLMGGEIADPQTPLGFRIHIRCTTLDAVFFDDALTSFTFVYDGLECIFNCGSCHIGLQINNWFTIDPI